MGEYTREKHIQELKAMRAELMAAKEKMESDDSESESANAANASVRKQYVDSINEQQSYSQSYEDSREEMYSHYSDDQEYDNQVEQGEVLVRKL